DPAGQPGVHALRRPGGVRSPDACARRPGRARRGRPGPGRSLRPAAWLPRPARRLPRPLRDVALARALAAAPPDPGLDPAVLTPRRLVLAQALGVAVLFALGHIVGVVSSDRGYTPFSAATAVSPDVWDATTWYAPAVRRFERTGAVVSGDLAGSAFDNFVPPVPTIAVGAVGVAVGTKAAWVLAQALLPALAWLLVAVLARRYTRSLPLASLVAWATVLVPFGVREIFLLNSDALNRPLELERMFQPAFSFPL